jgi:hypothetical protein
MQRLRFVRALGLFVVLVAVGCGSSENVAPTVSAEISKARAEGHKSFHEQLKKDGAKGGEPNMRKKAFTAAHKS